jgi:hypothetical protein
VRAWLRRKLLAWLGYSFIPYEADPQPYRAGTMGHAIHVMEMWEGEWAPVCIRVEYGVRRVPEVPLGTVRVVLEVP